MAKEIQVHGVEPFNPNVDLFSRSTRWKKWKKGFKRSYLGSAGITDDVQQAESALHHAGKEVQDVFDGVEGAEEDTLAHVYTALDGMFVDDDDTVYERHTFNECTQMEGEPVQQWAGRLRALASTCGFDAQKDNMIRDNIVSKCRSAKLRKRLLIENKLTLADTLKISTRMEKAESRSKQMESSANAIHDEREEANAAQGRGRGRAPTHGHTSGRGRGGYADRGRGSSYGRGNNHQARKCYACGKPGHIAANCSNNSNKTSYQMKCHRCGRTGHMANDCSAAREVKCNHCGKMGHFARVCMAKPENRPRNSSHSENRKSEAKATYALSRSTEDSDDDYCFAVHDNGTRINVLVHGTNTEMLIDSGATCNIISSDDWTRIQKANSEVTIQPTGKKVFAYGAEKPLPMQGEFLATAEAAGQRTEKPQLFYVTNIKSTVSLLGRDTAIKLNILRIGPETASANVMSSQVEKLKSEYKHVFKGLGKLKDYKLKLHIDHGFKPVAQGLRRPPFNLRQQIEKKLDQLETMEVIEKVEGPTPWVSPVVVVPKKNGDVRLCVDMRQANQAVMRERHPIPLVDDVLQKMNGATVFSKLDLRWGFHQIELEEDSRTITTFVTHKGAGGISTHNSTSARGLRWSA
jgi:hypothetical protein